jgi:hypothetical protein
LESQSSDEAKGDSAAVKKLLQQGRFLKDIPHYLADRENILCCSNSPEVDDNFVSLMLAAKAGRRLCSPLVVSVRGSSLARNSANILVAAFQASTRCLSAFF